MLKRWESSARPASFRESRSIDFERLYREHAPKLEGYLRARARRLGVRELQQASAIQDLVQDAFVRAFVAIARETFDTTRDFGPYLFATAHHGLISALRKRKSEVAFASELSTFAPSASSSAEEFEPRIQAVLGLYVRRLPEPLAGVYEQRFVLGVSQYRACEALGLSRRSLRTRESHLRRGLRKELAKAGLL